MGAIGEKYDKTTDTLDVRDFDVVARVLEDRIRDICRAVGATQEPLLFLTGDAKLLGGEYRPNFREAVAVGKVYKGTRKGNKPYHYRNLTAYIIATYNTVIANGMEADDLIGMEQYERREKGDTIICTRDKDLRMVPGLHYGWECGKQGEVGPLAYDDFGEIRLVRSKSGNKIVGGGVKFFFAQLLTGDTVDNIGGLRRVGPVKAFDILTECGDEQACRDAIKDVYEGTYGEGYMELLEEQSKLLWIVRERDANGDLVHYQW